MNRCALVDPATTSRYVWAYNPNAVEDAASPRQLTEIEPVAAGWPEQSGFKVRQQGVAGPRTLRLTGTLGSAEQHRQFLRFERLSVGQSVVFEHFTGERLEVLVTAYEQTRRAAVRSSVGGPAAQTYRLDLEILNTL